MASREPSPPAKGGAASRDGNKNSSAAKRPTKARNTTSGRPSSNKKADRQAAPRPVAVGKRARASVTPGRTTRLLTLLLGLCGFLVALDVLVLWAPITEHMDPSGYDRPTRVTGASAHLAVGVPATQKAWRTIWLAAGYTEGHQGKVDGPKQFTMSPGYWQVQPEAGELLLVSTAERRVTRVIRASDERPVAGWDFPMPPLALLGDTNTNQSIAVTSADLSPTLLNALLLQHDPTFFEHHGFAMPGLARARICLLIGATCPESSPTITRQVAHSMFVRPEHSWQRRGQEGVIALLLESRYSKEEILDAWLRDLTLSAGNGGKGAAHKGLSLGNQAESLGLLDAAEHQFGTDLAALNAEQSEVLAAGMRPFGSYSPAETLTIPPPHRARSRIPWALDELRRQLGQRFPDDSLHRDGLELRTTLHPVLQEAAAHSIEESLDELRASNPRWWNGEDRPQAAIIAMDPRTGAIKAMAASTAWQVGAPNPVTARLATAGSAFKPIVLAAAIGANWPELGPRSEVIDEPVSIPGAGLSRASTRNEDGNFLGRVSLRTATEHSRRPPFVRLGMSVGPKRLVETARALGVQTKLRPSLSLALGEEKLTVQDLCTAYATIANGGSRPLPRLIDGLRGPEGNWLERSMPNLQGAIDPRVASVVTSLLQGVIERGTAHRVRDLGFRLPVAASTGISADRHDAWMIGFTPDLVVALWIGTKDVQGLSGAGEDLAVGAWTRFMLEAEPFLEGAQFRQPPGTELAGRSNTEPASQSLGRAVLQDEDRARRLEERRALQLIERGAL